MESVTFETKCWEKDWKLLLKTDYLQEMITRCGYPFAKRRLMINNVNDPQEVERWAQRAVERGIIDDYVMVQQVAAQALEHYHLRREDFKGAQGDGYYYSIAELTALYLADTEWLLHFSSDAMLAKAGGAFIREALPLMKADSRYAVANPAWDLAFDMQTVAVATEGDFYVEQGFSDQCYLVNVALFQQDIFRFEHPASARYPAYGGELFEKRVDAYLRTNEKFRLTHKTESYIHRNIDARVRLAWTLQTMLHKGVRKP